MLARAIHTEHFLVTMFKKEISTAKELDLRPLDKMIIFRDRQTNKQNLPIIYRYNVEVISIIFQVGAVIFLSVVARAMCVLVITTAVLITTID